MLPRDVNVTEDNRLTTGKTEEARGVFLVVFFFWPNFSG